MIWMTCQREQHYAGIDARIPVSSKETRHHNIVWESGLFAGWFGKLIFRQFTRLMNFIGIGQSSGCSGIVYECFLDFLQP